MYYHNITKDDMLNGEGLRVVLWVSGCSHNCKGCHNPQTHDSNSGIPFDEDAKKEIFEQLDKDYISGITFSGGDPLDFCNIAEVDLLISEIRRKYGDKKTIWLYSGYTLDEITYYNSPYQSSYSSFARFLRNGVIKECDVFVDGRFVEELKDEKYHWAGSTNQRVLRKGIDF